MTSPTDLRLQLQTIRSFFEAEAADPFDGADTDLSGVDQIMDGLRTKAFRTSPVTRLIVDVPERAGDAALIAKLPGALAAYCANKIRYCRRQRSAVLKEGRHTLRVGIVFLAICLAGSAASESVLGSESAIAHLIGEGLLIAGWVALWHPMELLLYAWWPYSRDIRLYEKIRTLDLLVQPRPTDA